MTYSKVGDSFSINSTETELFFDNVDDAYHVEATAYIEIRKWDEDRQQYYFESGTTTLKADFDITDFDRITYSTTEGGYDPTNAANQYNGDYTSAFKWGNAAGTATRKTDVTNWDGNVGDASMDPVYEVASGELNYSALGNDLPQGYNFYNYNINNWDYYTYSYVTQFIVRSDEGNTVTLEIGDESQKNPSLYQIRTVETVGMTPDSKGTVRKNGRVESLDRQANNGWVKVEANSSAGDTYKIRLTCKDKNGTPKPFQIGAVRVLQNANSKYRFYTSAKEEDEGFGKEPHYSNYDMEEIYWNGRDFKFEDFEANGPMLSESYANKFSFFDRGTNLNCIVYTNPYTVLAMPDEDGKYPLNVVVRDPISYGRDASIAERTCQRLLLTDYDKGVEEPGVYSNSNDYWNKLPFTAANVSYDRNFSTNYATICLPFALTSEDLGKLGATEAYSFDRVEGNNAYFKTISGATTPDVPFMVKPTTGGRQLMNFTKKVVTATPDNVPATGMIRTYEYTTLGESKFIFQNGRFLPTASDADCKPFRAYFVPATSGAKFYNFVIDNNTTGIDGVQAEGDIDSHAPIYNISGQMVSENGNRAGLQKGVYIQDNRKFIIK